MTEREMLADLIAKVGKLIEYHHVMRDDINGLKQDVAELKQDVAVLKQDVAELKQDVAILKHDVAEMKDEIRELRTDVDMLKQEVAQLNEKFDRHERRQVLQGIRLENVEVDVSLLKDRLHA